MQHILYFAKRMLSKVDKNHALKFKCMVLLSYAMKLLYIHINIHQE